MTRLVGERLVLREFTADDEDAIHAFASDPVVTRHTDWGPNSRADTRAFLDTVLASGGPPREYAFAATIAGSGRLVGSVSLRLLDDGEGEVGYVFHRDVWSRGYATEATILLLAFGFGELGLVRIRATCHPDNLASARVLEKAGMRREGLVRDHLLAHGVRRDSLLYSARTGWRPGAVAHAPG